MLKKRSIREKKSRTMLVPLPPAVECSPEVLKTLTGLGGDDINGDNDKDGSNVVALEMQKWKIL